MKWRLLMWWEETNEAPRKRTTWNRSWRVKSQIHCSSPQCLLRGATVNVGRRGWTRRSTQPSPTRTQLNPKPSPQHTQTTKPKYPDPKKPNAQKKNWEMKKHKTSIEGKKTTISSKCNELTTPRPERASIEGEDGWKMKKKRKKKEPSEKKPRERRDWPKQRVKSIPHWRPRPTRDHPSNRHRQPSDRPTPPSPSFALCQRGEEENNGSFFVI